MKYFLGSVTLFIMCAVVLLIALNKPYQYSPSASDTQTQQILGYINTNRAKIGLWPLKNNGLLEEFAQSVLNELPYKIQPEQLKDFQEQAGNKENYQVIRDFLKKDSYYPDSMAQLWGVGGVDDIATNLVMLNPGYGLMKSTAWTDVGIGVAVFNGQRIAFIILAN